MKIFVSYGQDRNAPLVERIVGDLEAAGHEIWIDKSKIKAGDDWRRSILDGLVDTDWTLGFLSKHSTRDPGVCLDELAIALHVKGGTIATVLMESEAEVEPPVSVSRIQWLDMHDWAERRERGGPDFEEWYRAKLGEILALLAHPDTQRFAGEIKDLERQLRPVTQEADIGLLVEGFVGRAWLHDRLEDWRRNALDSRLFWLSGPAGTGKSAFAAWLAHRGRVNVIGLNLCRYNLDDRRDAGRVIRTLAFQVATRLPDYRRLVLKRLTSHAAEEGELSRKGPAALFNWLIVEPLRQVIDGGRSGHRSLIVIDGLDETLRDGRSELAEVLREHARKLPSFIAIVVTSRPEEPILRQFAGLQPLTIKADSPENLDDLRLFARDWLAGESLDEGELATLVDRAVTASEGNFLYLRMLREAVGAGTLSLFAPEGLPQGLVGLYELWFRRQFPDLRTYESYVPLIAVLAAAEHPVPEPWLARLFGWSKRDAARRLEGLGSLFERRSDGVAPFHKSLRDWLIDTKAAGAEFVVDESEGSKRLADALWAEFARWAALPARGTLDAFCAAELPAQLARLGADETRALVAAAGGWPAIRQGLFEAASNLAGAYAWEGALAWWAMARQLAGAEGDAARTDEAHALTEAGDILAITGRSAAALASYRAGLAIRMRLAQAPSADAQSRHDLSRVHDKIGNILMAQGNLPEALASFRDGLAIAEHLAKSDPDNAQWQRDLSVFYDRVGDILVAQGRLPEALTSFRDGLTLAERLASAAPDHAGWRRDRSVSHDKIGNVLVSQGNLFEALTSFRNGLAIAEELVKSDPGNTRWQRDLSVFYDRIGDIHAAEGKLAEAETCFRDGLAIADRLAKSDPGNAQWQRDLSVSHDKIGDALVARGDLEAALASYRAGLVIRNLLAKSDPGNAQWQSNLAASHNRIGDILVAQGDPALAQTYFRDGLAITERLAKSDPGNAEWQRDLAVFHDRFGDVLSGQDDLTAALASFCDGLAIAERLAKSDPGNAQWQRDLSVFHDRVGEVLVAQGDVRGAVQSYRRSLAIAQLLVDAEPGNAQWLHDLCVSYDKIGDVLVVEGELPEALQSFRDGLAVTERLARSDPDNPERRRDLSVSHNRIGDVLAAQDDLPGAVESFRAALAIRELLAQSDPGNVLRQRELSASLSRLATALRRAGETAQALEVLRQGRALALRMTQAAPDDALFQRNLAWFESQIAELA